MSALRFLCTPGEAWIRLAARLCGGRATVTDRYVCEVRFSISLSRDHQRMRIAMNDEFIVLDKPGATEMAAELGLVIAKMQEAG